MGTMNN